LIPGAAVAFDALESGAAANAATAIKRRTTTNNVFLITQCPSQDRLIGGLGRNSMPRRGERSTNPRENNFPILEPMVGPNHGLVGAQDTRPGLF
jgi:hypothetical protein